MEITTVKDCDMEKYITEIMLDVGVPAHLKGYHYLRDAILLSGRDMEAVTSVTKLLYPEIARRFKTTDQKVERAIRNAIEVSWNRGKCSDIPHCPAEPDRQTASTSPGLRIRFVWTLKLCKGAWRGRRKRKVLLTAKMKNSRVKIRLLLWTLLQDYGIMPLFLTGNGRMASYHERFCAHDIMPLFPALQRGI